MPPLNLYARVRIFFAHIGARDRGCSAHPGIPCVPPGGSHGTLVIEGESWQDSGVPTPRDREGMSFPEAKR
jgi:hypothetical protein